MGFITLVVLALVIGAVVAFATKQRGGGGGQLPSRAQQLQQAQDAEAEAYRWVERLGGGITTLDAGGDRAAAQALADASERHRAAQSQLVSATTPAQFALVTQTSVSG